MSKLWRVADLIASKTSNVLAFTAKLFSGQKAGQQSVFPIPESYHVLKRMPKDVIKTCKKYYAKLHVLMLIKKQIKFEAVT